MGKQQSAKKKKIEEQIFPKRFFFLEGEGNHG